jgi:predicted restriction endonuclease
MKLSNFTSLDPDESARGVRGLEGASARDRATWQAFHADYEEMTAQSELLWEQTFAGSAGILPASEPETATWTGGATEAFLPTKVRLAQSFFRRTVLASYNYRCCITGLDVPELLRASHIVPWAEDPAQRLNPRNGLCLSALHDAAFDRHLISFTPGDLRLVLSQRLRQTTPHDVLLREFLEYESKPIQLPSRFAPDAELLKAHCRAAEFKL